MKKYIWLILITFMLTGCNQKQAVLYQSDAFTVYADKVVQDGFVGQVLELNFVIWLV